MPTNNHKKRQRRKEKRQCIYETLLPHEQQHELEALLQVHFPTCLVAMIQSFSIRAYVQTLLKDWQDTSRWPDSHQMPMVTRYLWRYFKAEVIIPYLIQRFQRITVDHAHYPNFCFILRVYGEASRETFCDMHMQTFQHLANLKTPQVFRVWLRGCTVEEWQHHFQHCPLFKIVCKDGNTLCLKLRSFL